MRSDCFENTSSLYNTNQHTPGITALQYERNEEFKYKANLKLLAFGGFLILGSAAVVTALYLPEHMPTVIENVVNKLIPAYFYMILGGSVLGAGAGLGCLYYGRTKKTPTLQLNDLDDDENLTEPEYVRVVSQPTKPSIFPTQQYNSTETPGVLSGDEKQYAANF